MARSPRFEPTTQFTLEPNSVWRQPPFTLPTYIKIQLELLTGALFRRFYPNHPRTAHNQLLVVRQLALSSERFYFRLSLRRKNMIKLMDNVTTNRTH